MPRLLSVFNYEKIELSAVVILHGIAGI